MISNVKQELTLGQTLLVVHRFMTEIPATSHSMTEMDGTQNKTQDFVDYYLSNKQEYDSRQINYPAESLSRTRNQLMSDTINRYAQDYSKSPLEFSKLVRQSANFNNNGAMSYRGYQNVASISPQRRSIF